MKPLLGGLLVSSVGSVGSSVGSVGCSVGSVGSSSSSPERSGDALALDDKLERTIQQKIKNVKVLIIS